MDLRAEASGERLRRTWRKNPRLAEQALGGKAVVLHYEGRRVLGLNRSGSVVWSLIDGQRPAGELVRRAAEELGVPAADGGSFAAAVLDFLDELERKEIVVAAEERAERSGRGSAAAVRAEEKG